MNTLLHYAAEKCLLGIVEYLVNQKADINAKSQEILARLLMRLPFIWLL